MASRFRQSAVCGKKAARSAGFFFNSGALLIPGQLLREPSVALDQLLEARIAFDALGDSVQFLRPDPLAVVFAILPALQQKVRALGDGLAGALDLKGLLADFAADHAIDLGHLVEEA